MFPYTKLFVNAAAITFVIRNNSRMDIGRALAQLCREKEIKAADLARGTGATPGTISRYMSGRLVPSIEALEGLARVLGCRVYEIVARAEGITLTPPYHTPDDARWLEIGRAMEPQARYHVEAIAAAIAGRK